MTFTQRTDAARAICEPRWVGYERSKADPCGGCPLYRPCIGEVPLGVQTIERLNAWIEGINRMAEEIGGGNA